MPLEIQQMSMGSKGQRGRCSNGYFPGHGDWDSEVEQVDEEQTLVDEYMFPIWGVVEKYGGSSNIEFFYPQACYVCRK